MVEYSTLTVIIMVDQKYIGRFWTQLEAFLAHRAISEYGLAEAPPDQHGSRCLFIEMGASAGTGGLKDIITRTWGPISVQEAHNRLSADDVEVTNKSDKVQQLKKLPELDQRLRERWSEWNNGTGRL